MATTKAKTQKKKTAKGEKSYEELSKAGQWLRDHPNGLEGFIVNDKLILYGLSPFDPDYYLSPQ